MDRQILLPKQINDYLELRRDVQDYEASDFFTERLDAEGVVQARQLLAGIYIKNGSISSDQLAEDGTLNDENDPYWRTRSAYFGARSKSDPNHLYTAARQIECAPGEGADSLQIHLDELGEEWQEFLRSVDPDTIREVASLIKEPAVPSVAVLGLIREMLHASREEGIEYWIWGLQPKVAPKFTFQFGPAMIPMGPEVHLGKLKPTYIPFLLDVEKTWELVNNPRLRDRLIGRAALYEFFTHPPTPFEQQKLDTSDDWPTAA